jgi:hypothetical protein
MSARLVVVVASFSVPINWHIPVSAAVGIFVSPSYLHYSIDG